MHKGAGPRCVRTNNVAMYDVYSSTTYIIYNKYVCHVCTICTCTVGVSNQKPGQAKLLFANHLFFAGQC